MFQGLRILGNTIAFTIYFVTFAVLLAIGLFLITPWGWVLIPAALVMRIGMLRAARKRRGNAIVEYMDHAVRLHLPLPEAIAAAAASETGPLKRTLNNLAGELHDGLPPGEAMHRTVRELSAEQHSLILAGEQTGRLAGALRRVVRLRRAAVAAESPMQGTVWSYPVAMICCVTVVLMFISILIIPKFEEIFADFDIEMPAVTVSVVNFGKWMAGRLYEDQILPGVLWVVLLALLIIIGATLGRVGALGSLSGWLCWWLPVFGRAQRGRAWSNACFVIGESLNAGMPIDEALGEAAKLRVNAVAAGRLHAWTRHVREGQPLAAAAERAGLPKLMTGTLATAEASGNLPDALVFLGRYYEAQESWALALIRGTAIPAIIFAFALIVGWIVVGMITPLADLIWSIIPAAQGVDL